MNAPKHFWIKLKDNNFQILINLLFLAVKFDLYGVSELTKNIEYFP